MNRKRLLSILTLMIFALVLSVGIEGASSVYAAPATNCDGGSCKVYRRDGTIRCDACCPQGKSPSCSGTTGCSCTLDDPGDPPIQ